MSPLKIVHLFNFEKGSRFHAMISQGLYAHPDIVVSFSAPFISLGSCICDADPHLEQSMIDADYIFRCDDRHFGLAEIDRILDDNRLWKKVIYYDSKDEPVLDQHRLETCAAYFKRSWPIGYERAPRPAPSSPILPLDFAMLSEYFTEMPSVQRDLDLVYLFENSRRIGRRRYTVLEELQQAQSQFGKSIIGVATAINRRGRRALFEQENENPFLEYLQILRRARIVFTAFPEMHDGDSRTWEAFSSGALVCMDRTAIPSPHPFLHGKHCIIYDATDRNSIRAAVSEARRLLDDEDLRTKIASQGYEHARAFHKPIDRIDQMLRWLNDPDKRLERHVEGAVMIPHVES